MAWVILFRKNGDIMKQLVQGGMTVKFYQTISILNDLCYIFEALSQDLSSEAKTEIDALMGRVKKNKELSEDEKKEILSVLNDGYSVLQTTKAEKIRIAAIGFGRLSRKLWATVV